MSENTATSTEAVSPVYQNCILYRTTAMMVQPAPYTGPDGKTVTPSPITAQAAGYVVGMQLLSGIADVSVPDGFAFAVDASKKYPVGSIYTPSTEYTLTGGSTGTAGTPLTLTLTPNNDGPRSDTTVTLSDGTAGGTFSEDTVTFSGCTNTPLTVTYTPKAAGTVVLSVTNDGGLTNPANLSVTVSASATPATSS